MKYIFIEIIIHINNKYGNLYKKIYIYICILFEGYI